MVSSPPAASAAAAATAGSSSAVAGSADAGAKTSGTTMTAAPPSSSSSGGRPAAPPPAAFQNLPMSRGLAAGPVGASLHGGDLAASDGGHRAGGGANYSNSNKQTKRRMSGDGAPDIAALADAAEAHAAAVASGAPQGEHGRDGGKKRGRKAKKNKGGKNTSTGGVSSNHKNASATEGTAGDSSNRGNPHGSSSMDLLSPLSSRSGGPGLMPRSLASPPPAAACTDKGKTKGVSAPDEKKKDEDGKARDDDESPAIAAPAQKMVDRAPNTPSSPTTKQGLQRVDSMASRSVDGSTGYAADVSLPSSVDADADASHHDASHDPSQDTGMDTGESSGPYPVSSMTDSYSYSGMHVGGASGQESSASLSMSVSVSSPATIAATSEEEEDEEVVRGVVKRMAKRKSSSVNNVGGNDNGGANRKDAENTEEKTNRAAERKNSSAQVASSSRQRKGHTEEFGGINAKAGHRSNSAVDKHAAASASHLRGSDKTLLIPINDVGGNHKRYTGRSTDRVTSAVPYVTFGGTGHENTSDAGLSSLHSDLALSGDSSFDAESLESILESDVSVTGPSEGRQHKDLRHHHRALDDDEEDVSLGMEDLDEEHAVAAAAAKFNAMSGAASGDRSGTGSGGTDAVVGVLRRSSYGDYSCSSSVHHSKTNLHESMATVFSNGKTDKKKKKKSSGGGGGNKSSRNDRRSSASSPVPSSRSRRSLVRRSPSSKKVIANLRMNDSCASLLKSSSAPGNRAQGSSGSCNGSVGSGGRSSRGGLSGISGISLSSRSLVQGSGSQEYADASLFDNLDRNWLNGKADDDHVAMAQVTVERICLASFAIMFDGMGSGYPYKTYDAGILALSSSAGSSDGVGGLPSCDNVDLDGLNLPPPLEISGGEHFKSSSSPSSSRGRVPIVPVAVAHRLWSDVVLPSLPEATAIVEGKKGKHGIKSALESIVRTLTDDMNFLTLIDINGTKCLQLSHEMYADYGHYIAENYKGDETSIEDNVTTWHAQFAKGLKKAILNERVGSISDEVGLYSAVALPRHLLLSSKTTAECRDLLADPVFVARRMVVLGCRLGGTSKAGPSKIKIEKITSHAVIRATQIHIADIDCVVEYANSEEEQDTDVAELCGAWQAACASILDASSKKQLDPQAKERQQEREKRRRKVGSNSKQFDEEGDIPDSISTTDSSASETVVRGKDSAPEEIMRVSEDHRKKAPSRRVRSKKSDKDQKKVSFTFDSPGGPLPNNAAESDFQSDDASTLTGLTGSGASKALREYASRNAFADDASVDTGASTGITLRDVLNIDLGITKREAAIGKSLYLLSRSLRSTVEDSETVLPQSGSVSVSRASVHDAARLQIKLLAKSIELYASIVSKLSYLLSDDLDMIEEDDLAEMLLFETKFGEDASVMASKRLRKLHDDRREARSLMTTIQLMSVEAWYCLGANLMRASESGILSSTELSDVGLIDRLGLGSTSVSSIDDMGSVFGDDATVATSSGDSFATSVTSSNSAHTKAISCFRIAFSLLTPLQKPHSRAQNANVGFYSEEIKAAILHEFGLYQFENRGDMDSALRFFSESINTRKSFLQEMQDDEDEGISRVRSSTALSRGHMSSASIRSSALSSRCSDRSPVTSFIDDMGYVLPSVSMLKRRIPSIEAVLSSTLEYAALAEHSLSNYKASLAYFQEAIILRVTHAGKNSLEVASLQFNMGVVHDDAGEYEASLNRYSESLRIRMQSLEQMLYESDADSYDSGYNNQNEEINDLEITVILTLKCMGNVYRAVNEPGSALECYLSAIATLDRNMVRFGSMAPGLGHMHLVDGITSSIPLPEFVLDEMRSVEKSLVDTQTAMSATDASREELARNAANGRSGINLSDTKSMSDVDRILREMTNMYSTVIRLIDLKKEQADMGSDAPESKFSASAKVFNILSSNRAKSSTFSSTKSVGSLSRSTYLWSRGASGEDDDDDESILLTAAYNLGKLYMHFGQFESSIEFLEHCLRTLWAVNSTDGSSGAYSDSDDDDDDDYYSEMSSSFGSSSDGRSGHQPRRRHRRRRSSSLSKRKNRHQSAEEMIEEGAIFHLMAKAHAALSDHQRAVRCFVTGLRHYRSDYNSDDWKLAGALYDCGLSYWRLEEYTAAHKCWSDCLVHLDDINDVAHLKGKGVLVRKTRLANVLYNLAASNCALGKYEDDSTMQYLDEASAIYRGLYVEREGAPDAHQVGHCYFYLALIEYKHACSARSKVFASVAPLKMDSVEGQEIVISQDSSSVISGPDDQSNANADKQRRKDWGRRLKDALDYLTKAQNIYDSHLDILDQSEIKANRFVKADKKDLWGIFHPMQAHISHLSGLIYDKLGLFDKATKEYASALRLSNILYGPSNVHSASLLHRMGVLFGAMEHYGTALKCYGDSLTMRKAVLGFNHEATADTLFDLAGLHAHLDEYEAAIKAYDDCLKIRMQTEGLYGIGVVKSLTNTGIVHARYGMYERARDCLSGALKVSKDRVQQRKASFEVTNTNSSLDYASVSGYANDSSTQQKIYELAREKRELASILHHIANVYFKLGDSKRALSCFGEALRIRRWLCGHSEGSTSMLELAHQDFEEASEDLELAYRQFYQNRASKNYHNEEDLDVLADTLHSMGCVYEASKKFEPALRCYNESLIIKRRSSVYCAGDMPIALAGDSKFGAAHPESLSYAKTLIRIGCVQSKLSNHEIALSHLEPGLRLQRRHLGRDHPNVAQTLSEMGRCLRQRGLNTRAGSRRGSSDSVALKCYNEALRISKLRYGPQHVVVAGILYDRGNVLDSVGDFSEAAACYKQSLRVYGRQYAHSVLSGLFRNAPANSSLKEDEELGDASFDPSDPFASLLFASQDGTTDKEQYLRASAAFRQSILRSREVDGSSVGGLVCANVCSRNDNCLTWLELLFFQLFELAGSRILDPVRLAIQNTIIKAIEDIDQAGAQAIVTATDINYNFLYLIQE